jgi:hypothetical protein
MKISWEINQFEHKGGITPKDFKKKAIIDGLLLHQELN